MIFLLTQMVPQMDLLEERTVLKEEVLVDDSYVCQFCGHALGSYVELRTHMKLHAHQKVTALVDFFCVHKIYFKRILIFKKFICIMNIHKI